MAKYTELFSEYLETGGELPSVFDSIQGFTDLFKGEYCCREIGFETETLFTIKLETRANLVVPVYKSRIDMLETFISGLEDPEKVRETVHDIGEVNAFSWVLPFNSNTADPSAKSKTNTSQNKDTETISGLSSDEIIRILELLKNQVRIIKRELLDEFRSLFMMIY